MDYMLKDAIQGLNFTDSELQTLEWISGWDRHTIENIAMIITKTRAQTETKVKEPSQPTSGTE